MCGVTEGRELLAKREWSAIPNRNGIGELLNSETKGGVWWYMTVIPALTRLTQEDCCRV